MKKVGRAPINLGRENARPVGPEGVAGRSNKMTPLGELAGSLIRDIIRKRDESR